MRLLTAEQVVADGRLLTPGWVLFEDPEAETTSHTPPSAPPSAGGTVVEYGDGPPPERVRERAEVTALTGGVLAPGLVDMQINGAFGVDFAAAGEEDWQTVARLLTSTGTTAFVPTLITAPVDELAAALRAYRQRSESLEALPGAARPLGLHLEGPFLAERRRGAHRADLLCDPTPDRVDALLEAGDGALTYVTLAPERDGALAAVERLTTAGTRVAVGHCDADEATVHAAADAGATLLTHLYNAQRPLQHRDPGTVGAGLTDDRLTCGLIVDLHHVAPAAVQVAFRCAAGRLALVTDAVAAMGMPTGRYELGGDLVDVHPGRPPMRADGAIAGSAVRMDEAVANAVRRCGVDLLTAVEAATRVPADALGRDDLGRIAIGAPADLVWLDDDLSARATWVDGRLAWTRDDGLPGGTGGAR
jgi:N-acetylglucosamine-6-phosphate deacetylase